MNDFFVVQMQKEALSIAPDEAFIRSALEQIAGHEGYAGLKPRAKIVVSGYYYSGSGALLDFLADHTGVLKWPEEVELRFINLHWGLDSLLQSIQSSGQLSAVELLRFYLHLIGRIPEVAARNAARLHLIKVANRTSRRMLKGRWGEIYKGCGARFIGHMLPKIGQSVDDAPEALSMFFEDYNSRLLEAAGTDVIAYDRPLPPHCLDRLKLTGFSPAYVAVHRDPRSQFADICRARRLKKQAPMTPVEFIEMYRSRRVEAWSSVEHPSTLPNGGLFLAFEDLLTSAEARSITRDFLGLTNMPYRPDKLMVEVSAGNIDMHKSFEDQAAVEQITNELPDYLWPTGPLSGSFSASEGQMRPLAMAAAG